MSAIDTIAPMPAADVADAVAAFFAPTPPATDAPTPPADDDFTVAGHVNRAFARLDEKVRAALTGSDAHAKAVATLSFPRIGRKATGSIDVMLAHGHGDFWTPTRMYSATHAIVRGKENEYDLILAAACTVRGGTIVAIPFGFKVDSMGFPVADYRPTIKRLTDAALRRPIEERRRIDTDFRILANDQNADNASTVWGYILVKVTGFRVK